MVHCCFLLWVFLASLPICVSTLCVCVCVIVPRLTPVTRGCHEEQMDRVYSGLAACAQGSYSSLHCCLSTNVGAEATFTEKLLHF